MARYIVLVLMITVLFSCSEKSETSKVNPVDFVNPFIGTGGHGHTYPGASLPFGMMQLSPDTRLDGWDGCSGYHYSDSIVYGFTHTHLSGTGCSDYGDILIMPFTGEVDISKKEYASTFSHDNETAKAGYYSVLLNDYNINVELTTTKRCGFHSYQFPETEDANIVIDFEHRDMVIESYIKKVSDTEIEGYRKSKAWASEQYIYFVAQFSKPIDEIQFYKNDTLQEEKNVIEGADLSSLISFNTDGAENIQLKIGISAVSTDGARKNLEAEIPNWDFEKVKLDAEKEWNNALSKIEINGGNDDQNTVFYTALYHSLLNPNLFMDIDGKYRGTDLEIHQSDNFDNYTVFSLWDTYRATHPLFTIIERDRTKDFLNTFLAHYEFGGQLPVWELAGNYTGCMIGYHSIPVITDAYIKGITDFDTEQMLEAMISSAEKDHLGLKHYKEKGYIPSGEEGESVAKTLEYAYDDWCIAQYAKAIGNEEVYTQYSERAQYYKNVFDPETKFMRAKNNDMWFAPFDPKEVNFNYTEANSWQYSFYVPQDINTLIDLHGGNENFIEKLDQLFTESSETTGRDQADITGLIGQYAHGNEPSHHMAYLYAYAGQPWKTQQYIRQILDQLYSPNPDGLSGNEDCGQMSSWYILSALGFYPVTPGSDIYIIGTPLFPDAKINLENGKEFKITANNVDEKNIYIQSAKLNGVDLGNCYIAHNDIMNGGELVFEMGPQANENWGTKTPPISKINENIITIVPYIKSGDRTFRGSQSIEIESPEKNAKIFYTIDGTIPTEQSNEYIEPIDININTTIKAIAVNNGVSSKVMSADFSLMHEGWSIELKTKYENQYAAGGDEALIDCLYGATDFKTGTWQGYQGIDLEAIVDRGKIRGIKEITVGFLQDQNSWIFMPEYVEFYVSIDNINFIKIGTIENDIPADQNGGIIKNFTLKKMNKARYIKIIAKNRGVCPPGHLGEGNPSWIFVDEITIKE